MNSFDYQPRTRVVFGAGAVSRLGELAGDLNFRKTLLVADSGLVTSGHVAEALTPLREAGIEVIEFHDFAVNPDTRMVEAGSEFAASLSIDSIIALGGGSSLDCAKAINLLLTNGGGIRDYHGYGKATRPLLPMIGIPTTAGTGSEAQSYALISDAETHVKLACGDPGAAFRIALLDPALTVSQPADITATAGFDAVAHAVETFVTTGRNAFSEVFSREAWRLLERNYERVITEPDNLKARGAMQLGAYFAGVAIENSMLGATHACANPLTAHYGTAHGASIAILLPSVVRWNAPVAAERYAELLRLSTGDNGAAEKDSSERLARRLEELATAGGLNRTLGGVGVPLADLSMLAEEAAEQWTGRFNPRPFDSKGALEVYQCAF
ncbi:MAG TPA: iron-containing alcohol dehydrogenase [Pyrinomonadaceae bacterium]|jgi:alcohol dehydrogenase|nr:iron-containing alcohol dehydrogenase [Pyrinomonadaceae bacterium]